MSVLLEWSEALILGMPEIDDQHEDLVLKLNELHDAIESRAPQSRQGRLQKNLLTALSAHFAAEERLLRLNNCPSYETHAAEHNRLLRMVSGGSFNLQTTGFIRQWLANHLANCDVCMERELRRKP